MTTYNQEESKLFFSLIKNLYTISRITSYHERLFKNRKAVYDFIPYILNHVKGGRVGEAVEMQKYMEETFIDDVFSIEKLSIYTQEITTNDPFQVIYDYISTLKWIIESNESDNRDEYSDLDLEDDMYKQLEGIAEEILNIYSYGYNDETKDNFNKKNNRTSDLIEEIKHIVADIVAIKNKL